MSSGKASLKKVRVEISFPLIGKLEGTWEADTTQQSAAWEMYVELITRISVVELKRNEGLLREALTSLYTLFGTTRDILRRHGPGLATVSGGGNYSFGFLAIAILNGVLRPLLARWHPLLLDHESRRPPRVSVKAHEESWKHGKELRRRLDEVQLVMAKYADLLAKAAGVTPIHRGLPIGPG